MDGQNETAAAATGSGGTPETLVVPAPRKNPIATANIKVDYLAGTPKECQEHAAQVVAGLRAAGLKVTGTMKVHNSVTAEL